MFKIFSNDLTVSLGSNPILAHYLKCSSSYRSRKRKLLAAVVIDSRKYSRFSTSVRYTSFFKYPHTKKYREFRSGDREGQTTGPAHSIQRILYRFNNVNLRIK